MSVGDAQRLFPIERDGAQSVQKIYCSKCDKSDRNVLTGKAAAGDDTLVSFFRRRGWFIKRNAIMCPDCLNASHAESRARKIEKTVENMAESKLSVVAQAPTPNSVLAKKIMSDLLFEHYDTAAQDYRPNWDDARVAKESGLSETFVAQRRSADYGPTSPPKSVVVNEAVGMADKIKLLAKDAADMARSLDSRAKSLLDEAERLSSVLKNLTKKVA